MFHWLRPSTIPPTDSEWKQWLDWQRGQPSSLYDTSDMFAYYRKHRPDFRPPAGSIVNSRDSHYFQYCFGDFANIIVLPDKHGSDATKYFTLLLDIYDTCKGLVRRFTGDPEGIDLLRLALDKRKLSPLFNHNFNAYAYNYDQIHAHTVCQFSLSTLIMRLVSNYMSQTGTREYYPAIYTDRCKKCHDSNVFGLQHFKTTYPPSSMAIPIPIAVPSNEESRAFSWPRDISTCLRCKKCKRVTENVYGDFSSCLDCHTKRICSVCGDAAILICDDGLPKCGLHQDY